MTARDRTVVIVLLAVAILAGFWFAILGPKRKDADALQAQIQAVQQQVDTAHANAAVAEKAKREFDLAYTRIARLGKAVPVDDDVASLVYQLDRAAENGKVNFQAITLTGSGSTGAPAPAATPAPSTGTTAGTTGTTATSATTPAPATQIAVAGLPPGAAVGAAGLPTMPFSFVFNGTFFELEDFLRQVNRFISFKESKLNVQGRLLTIDGISLAPGPAGYPRIKADISATAFLLPAGEGLFNGATPTGPATTTVSGAGTTPSGATASATTSTGANG